MKVFTRLSEIDVDRDNAVSIGTFDGLHLGHAAVLGDMIEYARINDLGSLAYTFSNNPLDFILKRDCVSLILGSEEKKLVFEELGTDCLVSVPFDDEQMNMTADYFVEEVVIEKLRARAVFVGHDFSFGKGGTEGALELRERCKKHGVEVFIHEPVMHDGLRISSTQIRRLLAEGDLVGARELLGRDYFVIGNVVRGLSIGKSMGIPTINFRVDEIILKTGVYVTRSVVDGVSYQSVTNIGVKPTVTDVGDMYVETHLIDFEGDLYGREVRVDFLKRLRDEKKFENREELTAAIEENIEDSRRYFAGVCE